ncbi:MAG: ATP-binding cassette domain-containing protein [Acidobacteria bacterium]|nr:ATP-binding cassette domain-containing protein [Acidobacteriota bacterium]
MSNSILISSATTAIEFRNVSISFDDVRALQNVSFSLGKGEMICLTGDSQSGKSVLLRLALGFLQPDEGEIWINGQNIVGLDETELLAVRRGLMGMVFQENALFTGQTVYENAAYRLNDQEWPEEDIEKSVLEVLTFVGLQNDLEKQAEALSGGMKRRLELARALIGWPKIMLYDEPTAGLDPINAHQVMDLIIRARDLHGISALYVTKMLGEISYLANHRAEQSPDGWTIVPRAVATGVNVMLLEEGRIVFFGSPQEFQQSPLPAVQHMLHPVTDALHDNLEVADPWAQNRRSRDKNFLG